MAIGWTTLGPITAGSETRIASPWDSRSSMTNRAGGSATDGPKAERRIAQDPDAPTTQGRKANRPHEIHPLDPDPASLRSRAGPSADRGGAARHPPAPRLRVLLERGQCLERPDPRPQPVGLARSIASVGFGLSAICVGIDRGWVTHTAGRDRVRTTLQTFWNGPQGHGHRERHGLQGPLLPLPRTWSRATENG